VFGGVEQEISGLRRLFDPFATRSEWLEWLGGWLAVDLDETWDDVRKRRTIAQAFDMYRRRGTAEGLRDALLQLAGVDTRVEEPIQQAAWWLLPQNAGTPPLGGAGSILGFTTMLAPAEPQGAVAGTTAVLDQSRLVAADDLGAALFEDVAHQFSVTVYRGQVNTEQKLNAVRTLVDREKPAHTLYHVCVIDPKMRIGFQARLGIDTVIAGPTLPTRLGELTASGPEMILGGAAPGRIGEGSRLGQTTRLGDAAVEGPTLSR
jgi:phage tail-like protein